MRDCDRELERCLASLPTRTLDIPGQPAETAEATGVKTGEKRKRKTKKVRDNEPAVDLKGELKRIGGKVVGKGRRKVKNRVAMALRMAATTLLKSGSYLGGRYRHLRRALPFNAAAVKAMARYLGVLVYRLLTHGQAWVDRGAAKFEQRRKKLDLASLNSRALAKGFKLVPLPG